MGPTASGKTRLAMELTQHLPCEIISVDSALVYRGMDIGTAKPTPEELKTAPHHLIDILDPAQPYSAGQFCADAKHLIEQILARDRIPLLVGGTMLYFRALQQGLSPLPKADPEIRQKISEEAEKIGWAALHQRLQTIDPVSAARIAPQDTQRIQRALEVYEITGLSLTEFCEKAATSAKIISSSCHCEEGALLATDAANQERPKAKFKKNHLINIGLMPSDRTQLARRIEQRFHQMLKQGFVAEVETLRARGDLHKDLPSMRAVGYRQVWEYLEGKLSAQEMQERGIIATRQLAKRQMTWLRSWPDIACLDPEESELLEKILRMCEKI